MVAYHCGVAPILLHTSFFLLSLREVANPPPAHAAVAKEAAL